MVLSPAEKAIESWKKWMKRNPKEKVPFVREYLLKKQLILLLPGQSVEASLLKWVEGCRSEPDRIKAIKNIKGAWNTRKCRQKGSLVCTTISKKSKNILKNLVKNDRAYKTEGMALDSLINSFKEAVDAKVEQRVGGIQKENERLKKRPPKTRNQEIPQQAFSPTQSIQMAVEYQKTIEEMERTVESVVVENDDFKKQIKMLRTELRQLKKQMISGKPLDLSKGMASEQHSDESEVKNTESTDTAPTDKLPDSK
ncbi:MAG TPA: hypothetical protein PLF22_00835 [Pseudomonadales bacterium]|nr:hypothetical protein [Pseudomonadales bacterium]